MSNVSGALAGIVSDDIRERAVQYWKNIDKKTGDKIEQAVRDARGWPAYFACRAGATTGWLRPLARARAGRGRR
ncbi:MAG TPA: catalase-related domain-containing protein [Kribbella sp.]